VERNLSQRDIEAHMQRHFDVIEMNIWGDRTVANVGGQTYTEKSFAKALQVQYTPTLLFFNEKGRIVLRLNGYVPPEKFKVALEYVSGRHERTIRYRDYVKANLPAVSSESLLPESFFAAKPFDLRQIDMPKKPIAVFFEQSHCPACEALHRDILSNPRSQALASGFYAVQLDMWSRTALTLPNGKGATAREWAAELNVSYAPTIILLDETGTEIIRVDSELKTFHTQSVLDYVSSGAYRTQKDFQRYISTRAENLIEQGENVDIWK
jgi:thioredoxin-related protein